KKEPQEVPEQQVRELRKVDVAARSGPEEQREQSRRPGDQREDGQGEEFDRQPQRDRSRRLEEELAGAVALLFRDQPDRDEGIKKRRREIVRAERRNEDAVERRQPLREGCGASRAAARLGVEGRRVEKRLADERTDRQQVEPEGAGSEELAFLHREERREG